MVESTTFSICGILICVSAEAAINSANDGPFNFLPFISADLMAADDELPNCLHFIR